MKDAYNSNFYIVLKYHTRPYCSLKLDCSHEMCNYTTGHCFFCSFILRICVVQSVIIKIRNFYLIQCIESFFNNPLLNLQHIITRTWYDDVLIWFIQIIHIQIASSCFTPGFPTSPLAFSILRSSPFNPLLIISLFLEFYIIFFFSVYPVSYSW